MNIEKPSNINYEEIPIHDDGIAPIIAGLTEKQSKVVVCDFDTLIYWVLYEKDEFGNRKELTEDDLEYLEGKLNELVLKVLNKIEVYFEIEQLYIFIRGKGNYRKALYQPYKANRPEKHPLTDKLYDYLKRTFNAVEATNFESEDFCATIARKLGDRCIVAYVDHDLLEIDTAILYQYQRDKWLQLSESEARLNRYKKLIVSEGGDNVNLCPRLGIKHFEKFYSEDMNEEELETQALISYIKAWKNEDLAKENLELCKKLVWLQDVDFTNDERKQTI